MDQLHAALRVSHFPVSYTHLATSNSLSRAGTGISNPYTSSDSPVPALDKEFDVALIGEKGTWYDHKVSVTNPVKAE